MDHILLSFQKELKDLSLLINFYELEVKLMQEFNDESDLESFKFLSELSKKFKEISLSKRMFNYKSVIISLYGCFEKFIETCLTTYISEISNIYDKYNSLPDSILKSHLSLSMNLIVKIEQPRYSGSSNKEEIISNLHSCMIVNTNYKINTDAFAQHTANFRYQVIDDSFSNVGISKISDRILKEKSFKEFFNIDNNRLFDDQIIEEEAFEKLNDLAQRRNEVAHGVTPSLLQNAILLDYVKYFENYGRSLINILKGELLYKSVDNRGKALGNITDVYKNGAIICFYTSKIPLKVGDYIIGKSNVSIIRAKIMSMKLNDNDVDEVDEAQDYEIGVQVSEKINKNHKLYFISKP